MPQSARMTGCAACTTATSHPIIRVPGMKPDLAGELTMYQPEHFRESRADVLHGFIAQHPLATLVAQTAEGLIANHIPMLWMGSAQGQGPSILRGHVARANRLWRLAERGASVLAIFTGEQHYVSPTWYPSKQVDGKVVPTWNYAAVHVHGTIHFVEEA